jgi:hypothetical protein
LVTTRGQVKRDVQRGREESSLISTIYEVPKSHMQKKGRDLSCQYSFHIRVFWGSVPQIFAE